MNQVLGLFIYWILNPSIPFWTMITGAFTFLLVLTAYLQLRSISKTSRADFIHKFKRDFFIERTRYIFSLIDENSIRFVNQGMGYFQEIGKKEKISSYEMDDLILGHFEDLGIFERKGIVDIEMVYELFDYYIESCWDNNEIKKYLSSLKGTDIYDNFKYIYYKSKSFGNAKKSHNIIWFWKVEWNLKTILKTIFC